MTDFQLHSWLDNDTDEDDFDYEDAERERREDWIHDGDDW